MAFYEVESRWPTVADSAFVRPEAAIIGGVTIGEDCYIGAGAVLRGDWGSNLYQALPARCKKGLRRLEQVS